MVTTVHVRSCISEVLTLKENLLYIYGVSNDIVPS